LVEIFIEKDNRFVKFHAVQSVVFHVAMWVAFIVILIVSFVLGLILSMVHLGAIVSILSLLIFLAWVVIYLGGVILGAIKSYGGAMFKFPIIGSMAEKWS
jgi:uncharacterized membrane protein